MKVSWVAFAAVVVAAAAVGNTDVEAFEADSHEGGPHLRALEEVESAETMALAPNSAPAGGMEAMPGSDAPKGELEQFNGGWGCNPGAWNWPRCRWGGPWGCYPGSWEWPRCRWRHRCHPGMWYWPRCRYW